MNEVIEMLNKIIEMQERNYGNGINTHLELSTLVKEAKEVVKKLNLHFVNNNEMSVCRNCGKTYNEHSKASRMCPGKFNHFEAN